ncbi:MAG: hypothetical protein U0N94_05895 [Clostridia bacterium]
MAPTKAPAGAEVGLCTPARKANKFGFRTQTTGPRKAGKTARALAAAGSVLYLLSAISQKVSFLARKSLKACRMKFYLLGSM